MIKRLLLATVFTAASFGLASAAPITGSFSLTSFGGTYIGGTAATATGLDFGLALGSSGNGYGINGSALVGNATGSFASLGGMTASVADISLATFANPYMTNPFISFGVNSPLTLSFTNAALTRSASGTSITVTGAATFSDGVPADTSTGTFSLATSSRNGEATSVDFTFTGNAAVTSPTTVPEPASLGLLALPLGVAGLLSLSRRRSAGTV